MEVLYTCLNPSLRVRDLMDHMPYELRHELCKYTYEDMQSRLLGKLLLKEGCKKYIDGKDIFSRIQYNGYGKPYIPDSGICFSVTHSGRYVALSISCGMEVGIDIEEIKDLDLLEFKNAFSENEWMDIVGSASPLEKFYIYWTKKESAAKADGRGLSIPLHDILIENNTSVIYNKKWVYQRFNPHPGYVGHIASAAEEAVSIKKVEFADIFYRSFE